MIRYLTAGESHGPELTGILEGDTSWFQYFKKILRWLFTEKTKRYWFWGQDEY